MIKPQIFIDITEDQIVLFKIQVQDLVIDEINPEDKNSRELQVDGLVPFIGEDVELIYCTDFGKKPMFLVETMLVGIDVNAGPGRLMFSDLPEVKEIS